MKPRAESQPPANLHSVHAGRCERVFTGERRVHQHQVTAAPPRLSSRVRPSSRGPAYIPPPAGSVSARPRRPRAAALVRVTLGGTPGPRGKAARAPHRGAGILRGGEGRAARRCAAGTHAAASATGVHFGFLTRGE